MTECALKVSTGLRTLTEVCFSAGFVLIAYEAWQARASANVKMLTFTEQLHFTNISRTLPKIVYVFPFSKPLRVER